jgi:alkyl sulfatase BDS1-like metallo-beta-lactamase superfamily hydrolase
VNSFPPDPRKALAGVGQLLGRAADPLADRFAKIVREMPNERLDWLMRTPVRRVVLEGIFWQMPLHLDRARAVGVNSSLRWRITGRGDGEADVYDLVIADGRCRVTREGEGPTPRLTITVDAAEFLRIAAGTSNPVNAYFNGKLSLRGDLMQAARLTMLFRIPSPPRKPAGQGP